jgi:hypothetical protein
MYGLAPQPIYSVAQHIQIEVIVCQFGGVVEIVYQNLRQHLAAKLYYMT